MKSVLLDSVYNDSIIRTLFLEIATRHFLPVVHVVSWFFGASSMLEAFTTIYESIDPLPYFFVYYFYDSDSDKSIALSLQCTFSKNDE